jgi:hypothetical protein
VWAGCVRRRVEVRIICRTRPKLTRSSTSLRGKIAYGTLGNELAGSDERRADAHARAERRTEARWRVMSAAQCTDLGGGCVELSGFGGELHDRPVQEHRVHVNPLVLVAVLTHRYRVPAI